MDLQTLLGAAYKDGMTLDEINAALESRDLIDRSEMTNQLAAQKRLLDKANSQVKGLQSQLVTAGTKETDYEQRIASLEERANKAERAGNIATHKASLLALGYDDALANETAEAIVDNNIALFMANQAKAMAARDQKNQDAQLKNTKPPAAGGTGGTPSRDFEKEIQEATNNHDFALARALMRAKAEAEQNK